MASLVGSDHSRIVALSVILILGATMRLYGVTSRGIYDYDEAWFLLEAKSIYNSGRYVAAQAGLRDDADVSLGLREYVKKRGTVPLTSIKPGHRALILAGMLALGPYDYAGIVVSALGGLATILLVYLVGRRLFGTTAGIFAALCLAVSPLHIHYSRSVYAQSNVLCWAALGLWLWVRLHTAGDRRPSRLIAPGIAIGWAFTCHFNTVWLPVGLLFLDALVLRFDRPGRPWIANALRRGLVLGISMASPLLLFDLAGRALKLLGAFPADYPTYLGQFLKRESQAQALELSLDQVPFWSGRLLQTEGPLLILLAVLGIVLAARGIRTRDTGTIVVIGLLTVALVPPSLLNVRGLFILRNYALALIPLSMLAGVAASRLCDYVGRSVRLGPQAGYLLAAAIAVAGVLGSWDLLTTHSSYRAATHRLAAYIKDNGGAVATLPRSAWPLWYFYLSEAYDTASDEVRGRIRFYPESANDGDYELFDTKRYYRAVLQHNHLEVERIDRIRTTGKTAVRVPNPAADLPFRFQEAGGRPAEEALVEMKSRFPAYNTIEVVDLRM